MAGFTRREFLKLTAAAGVAFLSACRPGVAGTGEETTLQSLEFGTPEVLDSYDFISTTGEELRVETIRAESLKPISPSFWNITPELSDKITAMDRAISQVSRVVRIKKKLGEEYVDVLLPGSLDSLAALQTFNEILTSRGLRTDFTDQEKATYYSLILDPTISVDDKIAILMSTYISVPDEAYLGSIRAFLDWINPRLIDIPDNVPWKTMLDIYASSKYPMINNSLYEVAQATGTGACLFIQKNEALPVIEAGLREMFIPIESQKPRVFMVTYQPPTPIDQTEAPAPVTIIQTFYEGGDNSENRQFKADDLIKNNPQLFIDPVSIPQQVIDGVSVMGAIISCVEVATDSVSYAFIPKGMSKDKGVIKPVIFLSDPQDSGDITRSVVLDLTNGEYKPRVHKNKKNWISNITPAITALQAQGVTEVFKYGLLTAKEGFGRIFRGNGADNQGLDPTLKNMALFPEDQRFADLLASLYLAGETLDQWGVVIKNSKVCQTTYRGIDYLLGSDLDTVDSTQPFGQLGQGEFVNIQEIVKILGENYVPYSNFHSENGLSPDTRMIVGAELEDVIDKVIVMGTKNELTQALKTFGDIAPWALTLIAAFIPPASITSGLRGVLTWISRGLIH